METPTIVLPSRATATIRPLLIREENMLAGATNSALAAQQQALEDILRACVVAMPDPGPYTPATPEGLPEWDALLSGDKFALMLEIRKISYREGAKFIVMDLRCPNRRCPPVDYEIDLNVDVSRREISDEAFLAVASGDPLVTEVEGHKVSFRLLTGAIEELARKLDAQNPGRQIAAMIRARITDVEGLKRSEIMDWLDGNNGASKNFPGLSSQCAEDLRDAFDEAECGIDTDVEITCAKCGMTYNVPIPFGSGFLAPATAIQQRRRARRHGAASSGC